MLQNDTFCIFLSFHSTSCFVFLETLDAEKKKRWGRGECDSGSEWDEREQNWRNETGFIQVCLFFFFLVVAFVRVFLLLPSVAVAWFGVVKSRWGGGVDHLSPALLSFSASRRPFRLSSSFLWRWGCAWWGDGSARGDPSILVLCFLLRGLQDLKEMSKDKDTISLWLSLMVKRKTLNYYLRNKVGWWSSKARLGKIQRM